MIINGQDVQPGDEITVTIRGRVPALYEAVHTIEVKDPRPKPVVIPVASGGGAADGNGSAPAGGGGGGVAGVPIAGGTGRISWNGWADTREVYSVAGAKVTVTYSSKFRNGVHIDLDDGSYWMRRPDGWHRMAIGNPQGGVRNGQQTAQLVSVPTDKTAPVHPQRLREDREWDDDADDEVGDW